MLTTALKPEEFSKYGEVLYRWLGTFWTRLYQDRAFLRGLQRGRSLRAAQTYLNILESVALLDRNGAPVFHRERWYPLVVKRAERGLGNAVALKFGAEGAVFGDANLRFGGCFNSPGFVSFPIEPVVGVMTCIVDSVASPTKVLVAGQDFVCRDNTVVLREEDDPFGAASSFAVSSDGDSEEAVLWACDVLKDEDLTFRSVGYAMGVHTESSEFCKNVLNRVWDMLSGGATPALLNSLLGAVYGIPTCLNETETVELVRADGVVVTDANVYATDPDFAVLHVGDVLYRGDSLDSRLRVYIHPFRQELPGPYAHGIPLRASLESMYLSKHMLTGLTSGISLTWADQPVVDCGVDANGNPRLRFPISTLAEDDQRFWEHYWEACEIAELEGSACFSGYISGTIEGSGIGATSVISPLRWYLERMAGPGTVIVWVKPARPGRFSELVRQLLPANIRLVVVEAARDITDTMTLGASADTTADRLLCEAAQASDALDNEPADHIAAVKWINGVQG